DRVIDLVEQRDSDFLKMDDVREARLLELVDQAKERVQAVVKVVTALRQQADDHMERAMKLVVRLAEQIVKRNRKPSAETMKQDEEIFTLRNEDKLKWSWKKLGKQYDMTGAAARQAYARHFKRISREWK